MTIDLPESYTLVKDMYLSFSDPLVELLSLQTKKFYFHGTKTHHKITTPIVKPKIIRDNSRILFSPNVTNPIEIIFEGNSVWLPGIHWTMKQLNNAWGQIGKQNGFIPLF